MKILLINFSLLTFHFSTVNGTPPFTYLWSSGATIDTVNGLTVGTYSVIVHDSNGCMVTDSAIVGSGSAITATITGPKDACDSIANTYTVTATGGIQPYTYSWSSSNSNSGVGSTAIPGFSPGIGGIITWIVSDSVGCATTVSDTVAPCCATGSYDIVLNDTVYSHQLSLPPYNMGPPPYNFNGVRVLINGTFIVDDNTNFNGCDVQFTSRSMINVINNSTLVIDAGLGGISHFHAGITCCMWRGIIVNPGSTLITTDQTTIEDADTAVNSVNSGATQGILQLCCSYFNKNYEDIVFTGNATTAYTGFINNCVFTCRNFSSLFPAGPNPSNWQTVPDTTLLCPHTGQYTFRGIDVSKQYALTIASPNSFVNTFDYLHCGIYSVASNLFIYNNVFQNINFTGRDIAINSTGSGPGNLLTVGGLSAYQPNTFTNCYNGIFVQKRVYVINIIGNTFWKRSTKGTAIREIGTQFDNSYMNIETNQITNYQISIQCLNNIIVKAYIIGNTINDSAFEYPQLGIYVSEISHTTAHYVIEQNTINVLNYGIFARNLTDNPVIQQNTINLGNLLNALSPSYYNGYGIIANNCNGAVVANNSVTARAFSQPNIPAPYVGIYESMSSLINIECNSIYDATTQIECLGIQTNAGSQVVENSFNIPTNTGATGLLVSNRAFRHGIITGTGSPILPGDNVWNSLSFACRSHIFIPSYPTSYYTSGLTGSSLDPAVNLCTYSPNTHYGTPGVPPSCPAQLPPPPVIALQPIATLQSPYYDSLSGSSTTLSQQGLVNTLWANPSLLTDSVLKHFNDSVSQVSLGQVMQVDTLMSDTSKVNLSNTLTKANNIIPASNIEGNMQLVAQLFLKYRINDSLSSSDISALQTLANKCPFEDGIGVYQARAMLEYFDTAVVIYDDSLLCETGGGHHSIKFKKNKDNKDSSNGININIYPNPNNGTFTLTYNLQQNQIGNVVLYNTMGQQVGEYLLNSSEGKMLISNPELSNGVYYYKFYTNEQIIQMGKIIIIK